MSVKNPEGVRDLGEIDLQQSEFVDRSYSVANNREYVYSSSDDHQKLQHFSQEDTTTQLLKEMIAQTIEDKVHRRPTKYLLDSPNPKRDETLTEYSIPVKKLPQITPISDLNSNIKVWTIKARIIEKSLLSTIRNQYGPTNLFHVDLVDNECDKIRCSLFGNVCNRYNAELQVNGIYYVSGGVIKVSDKPYHGKNHAYYIQANSSTEFVRCDGGEPIAVLSETKSTQYTTFDSLCQLSDGKLTSVKATVINAGTTEDCRNGTLKKRVVTLLDAEGQSIPLKVWNSKATSFNAKNGDVIVLDNVAVSSFQGAKELSFREQTQLRIESDSNAEDRNLLMSQKSISPSLRTSKASNATILASNEFLMIKEVETSKSSQWLPVRAVVAIFYDNPKKWCYPGCSSTCNAKLESVGSILKCKKGHTRTQAYYKYRLNVQIADGSSFLNALAFEPAATNIMGIKANDFQALLRNEPELKQLCLSINKKEFRMCIKGGFGEKKFIEEAVVLCEDRTSYKTDQNRFV